MGSELPSWNGEAAESVGNPGMGLNEFREKFVPTHGITVPALFMFKTEGFVPTGLFLSQFVTQEAAAAPARSLQTLLSPFPA